MLTYKLSWIQEEEKEDGLDFNEWCIVSAIYSVNISLHKDGFRHEPRVLLGNIYGISYIHHQHKLKTGRNNVFSTYE